MDYTKIISLEANNKFKSLSFRKKALLLSTFTIILIFAILFINGLYIYSTL